MSRFIIFFLIAIFTLGLYAGENTKTIINVLGMKDKSCVEKITKEINKIDGVEKVSVDLKLGQVIIEHENVDFNSLNSAITKAGFKSKHTESDKFHGIETEDQNCTEEQVSKCNKTCGRKR